MTEHSSKNSAETRPGNRSDAVPGGLIGAIVIHLIVFALAFAEGFLFGASLPLGHGPAPADGLTGSEYAIKTVLLFYFVSVGIIPLVLSVIGYLLGSRLVRRIERRRSPQQTLAQQNARVNHSIAWTVTLWAAGLQICTFLVARGYMTLLKLSETGFTAENLRWIEPLVVVVWLIGALAAYIRCQCLQVSAWLIAIVVLLRLLAVFRPLPPYLLPSVAGLAIAYIIGATSIVRRNDTATAFDSKPDSGEMGVGKWPVFVLGGMTFYAVVCLYCLIWMMILPPNSEDWGPAIVLILGAWGIPVVGCIAGIVSASTGSWFCLTPRAAWIAVCIELLVCASVWLAMLTR
ncbi:MAG: hypothetical protein HQ518_30350 [Rhodopirellula sp.]|nr:hypothetical protein [Rhodopirellula sp.]